MLSIGNLREKPLCGFTVNLLAHLISKGHAVEMAISNIGYKKA
jgi:hypothetical protein